MRTLYERVVKVAQGAALMTETSLEVEFDGGSSELLPNDILDQAMQDQVLRLGPVPFDEIDRGRAEPFLRTIDAEEIGKIRRRAGIPAEDRSPLHAGITPFASSGARPTVGVSTDVGDVRGVPTAQCAGAVAAIGTPMHSWQLVAQGKLPAAHKGMLHAAKIIGSTAAGLFADTDLLSQAKAEFSGRLEERPYDCPIPDGVVAPPQRQSG